MLRLRPIYSCALQGSVSAQFCGKQCHEIGPCCQASYQSRSKLNLRETERPVSFTSLKEWREIFGLGRRQTQNWGHFLGHALTRYSNIMTYPIIQSLVFILLTVGMYYCFSKLTDANIFIILYGITSLYFSVRTRLLQVSQILYRCLQELRHQWLTLTHLS